MAVLAGTDFFTVEVLTWQGLATYYVLFFIQLETRRISLAGLTRHPTTEWMLQMARNATDESSGFLRGQVRRTCHSGAVSGGVIDGKRIIVTKIGISDIVKTLGNRLNEGDYL